MPAVLHKEGVLVLLTILEASLSYKDSGSVLHTHIN
jgi:hypothetical protein